MIDVALLGMSQGFSFRSKLLDWGRLFCGILLATSACQQSSEPAPAKDGAPTERSHPDPKVLVAQLGHPDIEVREAALKSLAEMGDRAELALREGSSSADPEIRSRSGELYYRLCARRLRLGLDPGRASIRSLYIYVPCWAENPTDVPIVVKQLRQIGQDSLERATRKPGGAWGMWSSIVRKSSTVPAYKPGDFVIVPPKERREIGELDIYPALYLDGKCQVRVRYKPVGVETATSERITSAELQELLEKERQVFTEPSEAFEVDVAALYRNEQNQNKTIREVVVQGAMKTSKDAIFNVSGITPGKQPSPELLERARERILGMEVIKSVRFEVKEIPQETDWARVVIIVEEK